MSPEDAGKTVGKLLVYAVIIGLVVYLIVRSRKSKK